MFKLINLNPLNRILTGITIPSQSESGSNANERIPYHQMQFSVISKEGNLTPDREYSQYILSPDGSITDLSSVID